MLDLHSGNELVGWMLVKLLGLFDLQVLEIAQRHPQAGGPRIEALETEHQRGALMNQHQPAPQQVTHRPQMRIVNVSGGQNIQPQQLGQEEGIVRVIGMLDSAVLFHGSGIC